MRRYSGFFLLIAVALLSGCGSADLAGGPGTGSETTNSLTVVATYPNGTAAANAVVRIRRRDYLPGVSNDTSTFRKDTLTDDNGTVTVFLDSGDYTIETNDMRGHAAMTINEISHYDTLAVAPVLEPTGTIVGTLDSFEIVVDAQIRTYGLERAAFVDSQTGSFILEDIPAGTYTVYASSPQLSAGSSEITGVLVTKGSSNNIGAISLAWPFAQTIRLNTTSQGAGITETIHNFPVMIRLTAENCELDEIQSLQSSIFFTRNGKKLSSEIELWDSQNKEAILWVGVDTLAGDGTTELLMVWGNTFETTLAAKATVFDTGAGFQGVWHLGRDGEPAALDATQNAYNAANTRVTDIEGIIGGGKYFDGDSAWYEIPNSASSRLSFGINDTFTISAWVYADELDSEYHDIISKGNHHFGMQVNKSNDWTLFEFRDQVGWDTTYYAAAAKTWTHVVGVFSGEQQHLYVNGSLVGDTRGIIPSTDDRDETFNVCFGRRSDVASRYFKGALDEIRISGKARSAAWIKLCYENQRPDQVFVTIPQ